MEFGLSPIPGFLFLCPFLRFGSARTQFPAAPNFFIFSPSSSGVSAALLFLPSCSFSFPSCSFSFWAAVFLLRCPVPCCLFPLPSFLASFPVRPLPARPLPARPLPARPLSSRPLPRVPSFPHAFFSRLLSRALSFRALFPARPLPRVPSFPHALFLHALFPHALFPACPLSRTPFFRASFPVRSLSRAPLSACPLFARLAPSFPAYTLPGLNPLPSLSILQPAPRLNGTAADGTVRNGVLMSAQSFSVPLQAHPGRFMLPNC